MTTEEFSAVAATCPAWSANLLSAARLVLVDGQSITLAAERHGFTKQRLAKALQKLDPTRLSPGWVRRWVELPAADMKQVLELERRARALLQGQDADL
jgi:hypothetical protein